MFLSTLSRPFLDQRERWFLWLPPLIAAGIAAYFALPFEPSSLWLCVTPGLAATMLALRRHYEIRPLLGLFLALAMGFNAAQLETKWFNTPMLNEASPGPVGMTGLLYHAEPMPDGTRLTIKKPYIREIPKEDRLRYVRIKVRTPLADLPEPGARVNLWGPLWAPSDPVAPGDYDFRRNAYFNELGGSGMAYSAVREREAKYPPRFFWDGFNLWFEKMRRALTVMTLARIDGPQAPMTAALLSGNQSGIDKDTMNAMRISGLSHLLSISGVHVSAMGLLVYVPLRFLFSLIPWLALRLPIKKIAAAAAIVSTSLYTVLVGPQTPTVRSALTTGIIMFAIIVDRKAMSLRLVALAAMLLMLLVPDAAMGPSFQMSFAAVLAMVAAYEKRIDDVIKEGFSFELPHWLRGAWHAVRDIVGTSLLATAATTPFTLFHFQTFSFYGVAANMIAIPLTSFWVMPCLLLTYLFAPFGLAGYLIDGAGWGVEVIIKIAQTVTAWPFAQIFAPPMPGWAFGLFLVGGLWLCLWRGKLRFWGLLPIALACFYPLTVSLPSVFIEPEGGLWAVRLADGRLATYGKRAENFTIHQWRQRTLNPDVLYFGKKNPPAIGNELTCQETACAYRNGAFHAAFLLKKATDEAFTAACASGASAVIAPFLNKPTDCAAPIIIDAQALHEHGAYAITLTPQGPKADFVRPTRGQRPWSVGRHEFAWIEKEKPEEEK